ncbi:MAG: hypothetical protein E7412_00760 [Ruminococcaceae bacterium]|nr:hypothetical protein [Oscillospiraceae bacterium]
MKKLLTLVLALTFILSSLSVSAELPDFMRDSYNNYSAEYSFSMTFDNCDEVLELLKEIEMPDEINCFVDVKSLLESLLSNSSSMKLQVDMSDDLRKGEFALTSASLQTVNVNSNLSVSVDSKSGMWMQYDLNSETPVYKIIYSAPLLNKYLVIDLYDMFETEEEAQQYTTYMETLLSKDVVGSISEYSLELLEKYADIKFSASSCIVKIDNNALVSMVDELIPILVTKFGDILYDSFGEEGSPVDFTSALESIPPLDGLQLLGENGIRYEYNLRGGKIATVDMAADISVDLKKITTELFDDEWELESPGLLDFSMNSKASFSKIGKTKVDIPELTEENSFTPEGLYPTYDDNGFYEESYPAYPYFSAWTETETLPIIDGEIYVPLRAILESAYDDSVSLSYDNGVIVANSEYFPGFSTLTLTVDSTEILLDGTPQNASKVLLLGEYTYVGSSLFEQVFGWSLASAQKDLMTGMNYVDFYTQSF